MSDWFYFRTSSNTLFLLPCLAVGTDTDDGRPFIELAWLSWAVGVGA